MSAIQVAMWWLARFFGTKLYREVMATVEFEDAARVAGKPSVEYPPMPTYAPGDIEDDWSLFHADAVEEYLNEFDAAWAELTVTSIRKPEYLRVIVRRPNGRLARSVIVKESQNG